MGNKIFLCILLVISVLISSSEQCKSEESKIEVTPRYNCITRIPIVDYVRKHNLVDIDVGYKGGIFNNSVNIKFLAFYKEYRILNIHVLNKFEFYSEFGSSDTLSGEIDSYKLLLKILFKIND